MAKKVKNDPGLEAADLTSRRTLIGGIIAAVVTVAGGVTVAIINKGCNAAPSPTQMFTGRVFNKNNPSEKVRNAQVSMEGEGVPPLATTDSEGIFSFPLGDPNKEIRLRIEVSGYEPYDLRVVPARNHGTQPIPLTPKTDTKADLSGTVLDEHDQPIPGAKVTLEDFPGMPAVTTSTDGVFNLREIPRKYGEGVRVRVVAEGYRPNPYTEDVVLGKAPPRVKLRKGK
ncbi:MAG: carboxypeptidase-like regulatory domain-containing protein [Pyrinomonadaceae bacterium]|nr:carboxypeptidase-like regulatory domain-containing protein [Pyrinomonadaceae bacterium]